MTSNDNKRPATFRLIHGVLAVCGLYIVFSAQPLATFNNVAVQHQQQDAASTTGSQLFFSNTCPDATNFFSQEGLEESIEQNLNFHTRGGNLKSIQLLLDHHIDSTLEQLGVQFVPNNGGEPTQQVTKYLQDYYQKNNDPRGGYGKPLPGKYVPSHPLLDANRYVQVTEPFGRERWDASLGPIGPDCRNLLLVGIDTKFKDGTKWICQPMTEDHDDSHQHEPTEMGASTIHNNDNCHILSIGGNDNWQFEQSVMDAPELQGCTTHTFDCTLPGGTPRKKPNLDRVKFYNKCIAGHAYQDAFGREFVTYWDMLRLAQLTTAPPRMLKIDVEGFEYDVFSQMIQSATSASSNSGDNHHPWDAIQPSTFWLPQQIQVELHWNSRMTGLSWMPRSRTAGEIALLSGMMFTGGGYLPIFQDFNAYCNPCMEVLYFKALC